MYRLKSLLILLTCSNLVYLSSAQPTLIGALTTTFTPPTTCFLTTAIIATYDGEGFDNARLWDAGLGMAATVYRISPNIGTACYPPGYNASDWVLQGGYYSPGICPSGYTLAFTEGETMSDWSISNAPVTSRTWGVCCPFGFSTDGQQCAKELGNTTFAVQAVITVHFSESSWDGTSATLTSDAAVVTERRGTPASMQASAVTIYYGIETSTPTSMPVSQTSTTSPAAGISVNAKSGGIVAILWIILSLL